MLARSGFWLEMKSTFLADKGIEQIAAPRVMAAKLVVALALCASLARCAEVAVGVDGSAEPPFASVGIKFDKSQEQTQVEVAVGEDAVHAALRFVYHVRAINPDVDFACRIADIVVVRAPRTRLRWGSRGRHERALLCPPTRCLCWSFVGSQTPFCTPARPGGPRRQRRSPIPPRP